MKYGVVRGNPREVNRQLLLYALEHQPSLVIDCHNVANPRLLPFVPAERFAHTYVVPAESLYRFRGALKIVDELAEEVNACCVVITTFASLFAFNDEKENEAVVAHCWELIEQARSKIITGVENGAHCLEPADNH